MVVLHERVIRKAQNEFRILIDSETRKAFLKGLNDILQQSTFAIISHVVEKGDKSVSDDHLYHQAMGYCLRSLEAKLLGFQGKEKSLTHVVFERRGKREDSELELEFRRVCDGENEEEKKYPFEPVFASKRANSTGLQLADLVARPIGLNHFRPEQRNRAYQILASKDLIPTYSQGEFRLTESNFAPQARNSKKQKAPGIPREPDAG